MIVHDVIFMMTLHNMYLSSTIETTGAGVEKIRKSANPGNFITKMFLAFQLGNEYAHVVSLSTNKKAINVLKSEVCAGNSTEKQTAATT